MAKPAPFVRPAAYGGQHGKSWESTRADQLHVDDMVAGFGLLTDVQIGHSDAEGTVRITNVLGLSRTYPEAERVQAFISPE